MKGQGFLGWSDEKMRRMWLGREIVVADLNLPSPNQTRPNRWKTKKINPIFICSTYTVYRAFEPTPLFKHVLSIRY